MSKIEIKNIFCKVIFEWESEDNTIKNTVQEAIKQSADLKYADLRFADLRSSDLSFADLRFANLSSADLSHANLSSVDLSFVDLRSSNLSSADLTYANLRHTNLKYANLSSANLLSAKNKDLCFLPICCKWNICIIGEKIKIGCEEKTITEWDFWFASDNELETKRNSEEFKQIEAMYLAYRAYLLHLNK